MLCLQYCANVKSSIENFLATDGSGLNLTSFRATVSMRSILSSLKKQQTHESWT